MEYMYHDEEEFYYAGRWYTESDHDDWERYFDNIFHQFYDDDQEAEKPIDMGAYKISRDNITNRMEEIGGDDGASVTQQTCTVIRKNWPVFGKRSFAMPTRQNYYRTKGPNGAN